MHIHSYPTVFALGHKAVEQILSGPVIVEEKVDGSQFSMSRDENGELSCRSKGKALIVTNPEKMFARAVETAASLPLANGWVYRCEYLQSPKHNTLAYSRTPERNLVLLDVEIGEQDYLNRAAKEAEAARLGLECVPLVFDGALTSMEQIGAMLDRESFLGGCKIEGVVVKNYTVFTPEKKVAVAKFVAPDFAEKNAINWKRENPTTCDVIDRITEALRTEARWQKAVQHLRDSGELTSTPRDIGLLVREAQADILKEEREWIAEELLKYALQKIQRGAVRGLPEWYKEQLARSAFGKSEEAEEAAIH